MSERYRFIRLLGNGGMAEVYLAMARGAEGFEKPVAIKRVLAHLASDDNIAQMFIGEARLSMHLHHQNIVQMLDVARNPQGLFLVMELVNGWDLDVVLRSAPNPHQPMPEPLAAFIVGQVVAGLSHAYRQQVDGRPVLTAHRDVSPSNILLTVDGEVKIGDFGIARLETANRMTEPGTFKGKVAYAAPEAIRGEPVNHLSDQFSLGALFHELLVGQLPFGRPDNVVRYSEALMRGPAPSLFGISPELAPILRRMLSIRADERYGSIEDVGEAVAGFLSRCGTPVSASELSRFLATVALPVPPLELLRQPEKAPAPIPLTFATNTPPDASASSKPASAAPMATLDPTAVTVPTTDPTRLAFSFDAPLEDLGEWMPSGPGLDVTGELHGKPPPAAEAQQATQIPTWATDFTLETLRTTPPRAEPMLMPLEAGNPNPSPSSLPPRKRRRAKALVFLLVLGTLAAVGWYKLGGQPARMEAYGDAAQAYLGQIAQRARTFKENAVGTSAKQTPVLRIDSVPSGANIEIDGTVVGRTPLVQENAYAPRRIQIQLHLRDYRPWKGTFEGGKDASIDAKLQR